MFNDTPAQNKSAIGCQSSQTEKCMYHFVTHPTYNFQKPVAKSSANGLVGTGFASRHGLQQRSGFKKTQCVVIRPLYPLLSY